MKQKIKKTVAAISAVSVMFAFYGCTPSKDEKARVYIEDTKFMVDGKELWVNGVNTPWKDWNDFTGSMIEDSWSGDLNIQFWDDEFSRLTSDGINCTRI